MKKELNKKSLIILTILVLAIISAGLVFLLIFPTERRADYKRLSSESYDSVFLSMYPVDGMIGEDFLHHRETSTLVATYTIPNFATLESYVEYISQTDSNVSAIYLGIDTEEVDNATLTTLTDSYPHIQFELIPAEKYADYKRLSTESYDSVFLSMYPMDNKHEEDFAYYRGISTIITSYEIPDLTTIEHYLSYINRTGNNISTIYLGINPALVDADSLAELIRSYYGIRFEILLSYPSQEYWKTLSETECSAQLQAYRDFILSVRDLESTFVYLFSISEWLTANPANYDSFFKTNTDITRTVLLLADQEHGYMVTPENTEAFLSTMRNLIANYRSPLANCSDLSDWNIVFLGDSVIGNYTNSISIPGVVGGLTQANVFNLGYGGASAAETLKENFSLPDTVNALIHQKTNTIPEEALQLRTGMEAYLKAPKQNQLCFVISFGLNDYFNGVTLSSEDPYDTHTYAGALRSAVTALQDAYPEAHILLATPNYTSYFEQGTIYMNLYANVLENYANTVIDLSEELQVGLLDNYNELDINEYNWSYYLSDGCHPNETGRFIIGQRIAFKLQEYK